jgi:hypothetical protein
MQYSSTKLSDLLQEVFGSRVKLLVMKNGAEYEAFPALLSKNVRVGERPYRITIFELRNGFLHPLGHWDVTKEEYDFMEQQQRIPEDIEADILHDLSLPYGANLTIDKSKKPVNESSIHKAYKESLLRELEGKCDCAVRPEDSGFVKIILKKDKEELGKYERFITHNQFKTTDNSDSPFSEIIQHHDAKFAKKHRLQYR